MIKDLSDNSCSYSSLTEWLPITIFLEIFIPCKCSKQKLHCIRWITNSTISKAKRGFFNSIVSLAVKIIFNPVGNTYGSSKLINILPTQQKSIQPALESIFEFRDLSVLVNFYVSNSVKSVHSEFSVIRNSISVYCSHYQWELYGTNFKLWVYSLDLLLRSRVTDDSTVKNFEK